MAHETRPSFSQDLAWRLEAFGFDLFTFLFRLLPTDWASWIGGKLVKAIGPLSGSHKIARRNLLIAFPEKDEAWRRDMLARQWEGLGRSFAEFTMMDRIRPSTGRVELVNGERRPDRHRRGSRGAGRGAGGAQALGEITEAVSASNSRQKTARMSSVSCRISW